MIRQFSAGGVVYRIIKERDGNTQTLFLLRRGGYNPKFPGSSEWSLPKGWIDDAPFDKPGPRTLGEIRASALEIEGAAVREVAEETGVEARIVERLGAVKFFSQTRRRKKYSRQWFFI